MGPLGLTFAFSDEKGGRLETFFGEEGETMENEALVFPIAEGAYGAEERGGKLESIEEAG